MAVKVIANFKHFFNFSLNTVKNVVISDNFVIGQQIRFHRSISRYKDAFRFRNSLINGYKKPVITLGFGGLGLCLFSYLKQTDFFSNDIFPVVNAVSDTPKNPKSVRHVYNFIADIVEKSANAVVCIEIFDNHFHTNAAIPSGSGFIVKEDGLILTNAHVVANKLKGHIQIRLRDGRTYQGHVEDYDMSLDLATIRINVKNLPVMALGVSSDLRAGEWVVAIGSPLSLTDTVTAGVVSSTHRLGKEFGFRNQNMEYIQTDAAITFGNSGGPLVNLDGEVIGINAMKVTAGISFAIPIEYAKEFLKRSEEKKRSFSQKSKPKMPAPSRKGYIGVSMVTLTPDLMNELLRSNLIPPSITSGVLVWRVLVGSPAFYGGLEPGDVIVSLNDEPIDGVKKFHDALKPKQEFKLKVFRKGNVFDVNVIPDEAIS